MLEISSWVVGTVLSLLGLIFTAFGYFMSRQKSNDELAQERGMVLNEIKNLDKKMDGVLSYQVTQTEKCKVHGERIMAVEKSAEFAHQRIDSIEQTMKGN